MHFPGPGAKTRIVGLSLVLCGLAVCGCQTIRQQLSAHLTHWKMLEQEAVLDPIKAVGGDGMVFLTKDAPRPLTRQELATASPATLVSYYAPVFVQQRVDSKSLKYPYPPEYDQIGEARLARDSNGKLKSYVTGSPRVYSIFKKVPINGRDHVQLTYTAWYPAHPRTKAIDLEEADVDSCVLRITLDAQNAPVLYETIAACGCFHKVFVQKWVEDKAREMFGPPTRDKKYAVERHVEDAIPWEVAGMVDEPHDQPRRPVVFLKAGDHRVIGLGSTAKLNIPASAEKHHYELTSYGDLYAVKVDGTTEQAGFFDMKNGGKVRGAERKKEQFFMNLIGVDSAGQPRADDQIKLHFDESTWGDPTIYTRSLRLPHGAL
jgi:hypothetical protein